MDSAAGLESESELESESDSVADLGTDWESGSGTGSELNTESESATYSDATNLIWGQIRRQTLSGTQPRTRITTKACHGIAFCCRV
jgi:hypothetical protein